MFPPICSVWSKRVLKLQCNLQYVLLGIFWPCTCSFWFQRICNANIWNLLWIFPLKNSLKFLLCPVFQYLCWNQLIFQYGTHSVFQSQMNNLSCYPAKEYGERSFRVLVPITLCQILCPVNYIYCWKNLSYFFTIYHLFF